MKADSAPLLEKKSAGSCLSVYLLGQVDFAAVQNLQRALVYQVQEERLSAALVLCEHPPLITVGREGRPAHVYYDPEELRARRWGVRWVNRGGGCWLHMPGQMAVYAILALDRLGLGVRDYVSRLQDAAIRLLKDFRIQAAVRPRDPRVWVGTRASAEVGVAVRDWVSYYGLVLNVNPDLAPYRGICNGSGEDGPMTSLERERRGPLRPALVRELFLEHFSALFPFDRTALFFNHSLLAQPPRPTPRIVAAHRG